MERTRRSEKQLTCPRKYTGMSTNANEMRTAFLRAEDALPSEIFRHESFEVYVNSANTITIKSDNNVCRRCDSDHEATIAIHSSQVEALCNELERLKKQIESEEVAP